MKNDDLQKATKEYVNRIMPLVSAMKILLLLIFISPFYYFAAPRGWIKKSPKVKSTSTQQKDTIAYWLPAKIELVENPSLKSKLYYGKDLIAHTSKYLGPQGTIQKISNGMNCQNCHLDAGTKIWGNNYGSVASLYPKFRARSGTVETIYKRINDCLERSLNGQALDTTSYELNAMAAYINYIGSNKLKGQKAEGAGFKDLPFLDRAADVNKGEIAYSKHCVSCHNSNGEGKMDTILKTEYLYPPLWGQHSYNDAAGLYRISNLAKYVKYNMPLGASYLNTILTDEESWDVAAFINSQPRPHKAVPNDWPDIKKKPIDHPFGKFADNFNEVQHKYGPYKEIKNAFDKLNENPKTNKK